MQYVCSYLSQFHQNQVTYLSGHGDMLVRFSGQKVKGQGHSRRRHNRRRQPVKFHLVSSHFVTHIILLLSLTILHFLLPFASHCILRYICCHRYGLLQAWLSWRKSLVKFGANRGAGEIA